MEGYSVTEAASVLGVPTERVWELLARGVLAGTPDGESGMRVFLQPRPAPQAPEAVQGSRPAAEPERELSPFRELLTEFRNLTERYGQALLALGESRGEVAALRSRVDLLEARMELRLPPAPAHPPGWASALGSLTAPSPGPVEPALTGRVAPPVAPVASGPEGETPQDPARVDAPPVEPEPASEPEPAAEAAGEPTAEAETRSSRRHPPPWTTESFAQALARAEDPSLPDLPDLPGPPEDPASTTAAAVDPTAVDELLPADLPPADDVPVADELLVAGPEPSDEAGGVEAVTEPSVAGVEPVDEPQAAEPEDEALAPAAAAIAAPEPASASAEVEFVSTDTPAAQQDADAGAEAEQPAWQDEHYTAEIAEPDWFEGEAFVDGEPAAAEPAVEGESPVAATEAVADEEQVASAEAAEAPAEPEPVPESPPATEATEPARDPDEAVRAPRAADAPEERPSMLGRLRPAEQRQAEETVLWFGRAPEGQDPADEMEVAPTRVPPPDPGTDNASRNLDDALAALEALSQATPQSPSEPSPEPVARPQPGAVRPPTATPAGRAYRRLRRIFPA